ncbi:MAG: VPLPA-CTERM sorting domain-containing protein [Gammaproteobacteria bacterium]
MRKPYHLSIFFLMLLLTSGLASATIINFSGQLDVITDNGGARYSGSTLDQVFSGSFSYGQESEATTDPLFPGDYNFTSPPYGGLITDGTTATSGSTTEPVQVTIDDNVVLDLDTANLLNNLLGTSLSVGSVVDIADIDTTFVSATGVQTTFGLSFISLDSNAWTGVDFANFPLESGNYDHAIFFINELDASDNPLFDGLGVLDTVASVPIPATVWLFSSGLLGLIGISRRKKTA